jgi:hypothetical protein
MERSIPASEPTTPCLQGILNAARLSSPSGAPVSCEQACRVTDRAGDPAAHAARSVLTPFADEPMIGRPGERA